MKVKSIFVTILFFCQLSAQNTQSDSLKRYSFSELEAKYYDYNNVDKIKDANLISS